MTVILNFAHPITDEQLARIRELRPALAIDRVIDVPVHFTEDEPYIDQVAATVVRAGLTTKEWQTVSIIVNPPGFAPIASMLLAYLHGLRGEFPDMLRLARNPDGGYEVAEIVSLQSIRDSGRIVRVEGSA